MLRNVVKQARILNITVDIVHIYPIFLKIEKRLEKRIIDFALWGKSTSIQVRSFDFLNFYLIDREWIVEIIEVIDRLK